jgi:hypothetical protein
MLINDRFASGCEVILIKGGTFFLENFKALLIRFWNTCLI